MRTANERRQEMIELLCERRHETLTNLADYFNVSKQTVCSHLEYHRAQKRHNGRNETVIECREEGGAEDRQPCEQK